MGIVPEEAQSEGHKFGTQLLRAPYPPDYNEYNPTQEETLRKKKAKPPLLFSLPMSLSISPFKTKIRDQPMPEEKKP